jgi:hypothetical protein
MLIAIASPRGRHTPAWPQNASMAFGDATLDGLAVPLFRRSDPIRQTYSGRSCPR